MEGVNATPYEDNMRYFNVAIAGPVGTCYEGTYVTSYSIFSLSLLVCLSLSILLLRCLSHSRYDTVGFVMILTIIMAIIMIFTEPSLIVFFRGSISVGIIFAR